MGFDSSVLRIVCNVGRFTRQGTGTAWKADQRGNSQGFDYSIFRYMHFSITDPQQGKKPFHEFWFGWGYVESSRYAQLPMTHNVGFDTWLEALEHLKATTLRAYQLEHNLIDFDGNPIPKVLLPCCKRTVKALKSAVYCSTCRQNLLPALETSEIGNEDLAEFFYEQVFSACCDGTADTWEVFDQAGWMIGQAGDKATYVESLNYWFDLEHHSWLNDSEEIKPTPPRTGEDAIRWARQMMSHFADWQNKALYEVYREQTFQSYSDVAVDVPELLSTSSND